MADFGRFAPPRRVLVWRERRFAPKAEIARKKRAARGCKRPKSREETPKEGGGNATRSHCRAATICHRAAQKARVADVIPGASRRRVAAGRRPARGVAGHNLRKPVPPPTGSGLGYAPFDVLGGRA